MIVGDGSQSLYRKRDFSWADAGIHASGRVINRIRPRSQLPQHR